jgi:hypothetical protein
VIGKHNPDRYTDNSAFTWILESVIGDKNNQLSAYEYLENKVLQGSLSGAYGTFFCHKAHDPSDDAVMKVIHYAVSVWIIAYRNRVLRAGSAYSRKPTYLLFLDMGGFHTQAPSTLSVQNQRIPHIRVLGDGALGGSHKKYLPISSTGPSALGHGARQWNSA